MNLARIFKSNRPFELFFKQFSSYVQGQSPEKNVREYFYFIDHQGMLFLDDARIKNFTSCYKDKAFLEFFYKRIKVNSTGKYQEFPYISYCGRERNYLRVDDTILVYTKCLKINNTDVLCYNHISDKIYNVFQPNKLFMSPKSGRVYHPCPEKFGSIGLIKSSLAIEISPLFQFEKGEVNPPTKFKWNNVIYDLDCDWYFENRPEEIS